MNIEKGDALTDLHTFQEALTQVYVDDPCLVLPNALWKTMKRLPSLQCSVDLSATGEALALRAWDQDGLYVFWNKERMIDETFQSILDQSRFLIVHDDYFKQSDTRQFSQIKPFFRIKSNYPDVFRYTLPDDFYIKEADPITECEEMSELIKRCYKDLHPGPETVRRWSDQPVYDQSLWIWIMDKNKKAPAALGIAELDNGVPEGSLEWIQVLPEYQGKGLGKVLVLELLHRLREKASFTTVSGEVDNQTDPEGLYRSCGFAGHDVWWLLRK